MAQPTASATNEELRSIVIELARTELAAVGSALKFWGDWVASAGKYTQQLRAELDKADQGEATSQQFVGKLADLTREYLREVVALPASLFGIPVGRLLGLPRIDSHTTDRSVSLFYGKHAPVVQINAGQAEQAANGDAKE